KPEKAISDLLKLKSELKNIADKHWKNIKIKEVDELIKQCIGLYIEAKADDYYATNGDSVKVSFELINRTLPELKIKSIKASVIGFSLDNIQVLSKNENISIEQSFQIPATIENSQPYWLKKEGTLGTYNVTD